MRRQAHHEPIEPGSVARILVVKPCCFGDVIMATPVLRALRRRFPSAVIHMLTTEWCAEGLRNNPNIDSVYRYPNAVSLLSYLRLTRRVRQQHYDLGLSLDRSPLVNALLQFGGIPERAGIDSSGRGVGLNRGVVPLPAQHESELYLGVAEAVGASSDDPSPQYCPTKAARANAEELLRGLRSPIVVIHPGGAVNPGATLLSKRWPAERFGQLASELVHRHGASVVVVGADSDRDAVQATIDFTDATVTDLSARLSIPELAAICERANLYVGNDSGMSHLASAVGTPTVTIFGPTSPAMYRPLGPNAEICSPETSSIRPGSAVDLRRDVPRSDDVNEILLVSVDVVLRACERLLSQFIDESKPS